MTSRPFTVPLISTDGVSGLPLAGGSAALARHFWAGPENALLKILIDAVLGPTREFSWITLYGPTGVGKSHLLHGLGEQVRHFEAERTWTLLSGADFARGFARAVDVDSVNDWRERWCDYELLLLDDLQELQTKPAAQYEVVRLWDVLAEQGRQCVCAVRSAPFDWNWMVPPLRSRMEGSLVIPVSPPSVETAAAITEELVREFHVSPEVVGRIRSMTHKRPLTYPQVRAAVARQAALPSSATKFPDSAKSVERLPRIAKAVAKHFQVKLSDLIGPSRRQSVVAARGVAIYLARSLMQVSFDEIGKYFGDRDHTTILHACRRTVARMNENAVLRHELEKLGQSLSQNFEIQSTEAEPHQ